MREVYLASVGLTKVDLTGDDYGNVFALFQDAYRRALADSDVKTIDAIQVGIMDSEEFENRANIAAKVADRLGLVGVPAVRSETASSTGAAAFHEAVYKIRAGAADTVLVIAGERMKTVTTQVATEIMSKTVDSVEKRFGLTMPALMALLAQGFFKRAGIAGERVPDALSRLMHRAHALGAENPLAAFTGKPEPLAAYFDPKKNLPVATPFRRKDCSPICDGAAAIVLTSKPQAVRVAGLGAATDSSSLLDRADLASLPATRRAAALALARAGIRELREVEGLVVELHDAFNALMGINAVDLGLFTHAEVLPALVGAADPYENPVTGPHGRIPVNLSGGLKSRGHPVGGTGLYQLAELYLQLTGRFPNPRAQAPGRKLGLSQSIGGPGNNVYVTLIEIADSGRRAVDVPLPQFPACERVLPVRASSLSGRIGVVDAATSIHVTASGGEPIHVALLSVDGRRVFATLADPRSAPSEGLECLAGAHVRFEIDLAGEHRFQVLDA